MSPDCISAIASGVTAVVAIVAICLAKHQITESRNITRESTATNLYNHCLQLALQYPKLAEPALSGGFKPLVSDSEQAASYAWFVASTLLSCEEILAVTKNDPQWRASVIATLDGHTDYFRYRNEGSRPLATYYSDDLTSVIDEITANQNNPPEAQALRMASLNNA